MLGIISKNSEIRRKSYCCFNCGPVSEVVMKKQIVLRMKKKNSLDYSLMIVFQRFCCFVDFECKSPEIFCLLKTLSLAFLTECEFDITSICINLWYTK